MTPEPPDIDLGYGSTMMYLGGPTMEQAPLYISTTGDLIPIQRYLLLSLSYALRFGQKEAAYRLGISFWKLRHDLHRLYKRLGVFGQWEAATHLGWVHIPDELLEASPEAAVNGSVDGERLDGEPSAGALGAPADKNGGG